jgi:hypothetical protein
LVTGQLPGRLPMVHYPLWFQSKGLKHQLGQA